MTKQDYKIRKELECLYSWAEFYSKNQQWDKMDICQVQIENFKTKYGLE